MIRPRSVEHRTALLTAATRVFAEQGLSATTAAISKEAGVSTGTLFVHFESKPVLIDQLYLALKSEMGEAAVRGLPDGATPREQLEHLWTGWIGWATGAPDKRRALAHLAVAAEVTDETREALHRSFAGTALILERCRTGGPMRDVPLGFVLRLLDSIADCVADELIERPGTVAAADDPRSRVAFEAMWRAIAG